MFAVVKLLSWLCAAVLYVALGVMNIQSEMKPFCLLT